MEFPLSLATFDRDVRVVARVVKTLKRVRTAVMGNVKTYLVIPRSRCCPARSLVPASLSAAILADSQMNSTVRLDLEKRCTVCHKRSNERVRLSGSLVGVIT